MSHSPAGGSVGSEADEVRRMVAQLCSRWPAEIGVAPSGTGVTEDAYDGYPYLFADAFDGVRPSDLRVLAAAGRLLATAVFTHDKIMDDQLTAEGLANRRLQALALQCDAYRLLCQLFPPDSAFWRRYDTYLAEFMAAGTAASSFRTTGRPWAELDRDTAAAISRGNCGIARAAIAGLAQLANDDSLLQPLTESIVQFYFGRQMYDDLLDWRDDRRTGIPSLLLARAGCDPAESDADLARRIYYDGHAAHVLDLAEEALDASLRLCPADRCSGWRARVTKAKRVCSGLRRDMAEIVERNLRRAGKQPRVDLHLPATPTEAWPALAMDALRYVVDQWHLGYGEARDTTLVTIAQGTSGAAEVEQYRTADVFQRAIVGDTLCDARPLAPAAIRTILDYEKAYLMDSRWRRDPGGWSYWPPPADDSRRYFPEASHVPPDADSLAQVMQVLLGSGDKRLVEESCERPLSALLRTQRADGGLDTWIMPARVSTSLRRFVDTWGKSPDVAVTANLLYALHQYDASRFSDVLERGADYLEKQQAGDGSWGSQFYHGSYYPTYAALRALSHIRPAAAAHERALTSLLAGRRPHGGWGTDESVNVLDTAVALLAVHEATRSSPSSLRGAAFSRAHAAVLAARRSEGGWPSSPFIRLYVSTHGVTNTYGSVTITTAYVLKAALAWSRRTVG